MYEYQGCFYHGCIKCFPDKRQRTRNCHLDRTIDEVYEATQKRVKLLRDVGYTVVEKWGCEFREQKKTDLQLQEFLKTYDPLTPLEPRDALFGGRTGATTLYAKAEPEKKKFSIKILRLCTRGSTSTVNILWVSLRCI